MHGFFFADFLQRLLAYGFVLRGSCADFSQIFCTDFLHGFLARISSKDFVHGFFARIFGVSTPLAGKRLHFTENPLCALKSARRLPRGALTFTIAVAENLTILVHSGQSNPGPNFMHAQPRPTPEIHF